MQFSESFLAIFLQICKEKPNCTVSRKLPTTTPMTEHWFRLLVFSSPSRTSWKLPTVRTWRVMSWSIPLLAPWFKRFGMTTRSRHWIVRLCFIAISVRHLPFSSYCFQWPEFKIISSWKYSQSWFFLWCFYPILLWSSSCIGKLIRVGNPVIVIQSTSLKDVCFTQIIIQMRCMGSQRLASSYRHICTWSWSATIPTFSTISCRSLLLSNRSRRIGAPKSSSKLVLPWSSLFYFSIWACTDSWVWSTANGMLNMTSFVLR